MDFAESIPVFVPRVFSNAVTHALMSIAPGLKSGIDIALIRVDQRPRADRGLDHRFDGLLLNIREHLDHHFSPSLNHPEDWWLLFFERRLASRRVPL